MSDLPLIGPYLDMGGWAALGVFIIVSLIKGWIWTGPQMQRTVDLYEKALADKDKQIENWKDAYRNSDARGDILSQNQRELLESIRATDMLIQQALLRLPVEKRETSI